jgi:hypothetical protein
VHKVKEHAAAPGGAGRYNRWLLEVQVEEASSRARGGPDEPIIDTEFHEI